MDALHCHAQLKLPGGTLPRPPLVQKMEVPASLSVLPSSPQGQMLNKQAQVTALLAENSGAFPTH